jgi:hypothetical protein
VAGGKFLTKFGGVVKLDRWGLDGGGGRVKTHAPSDRRPSIRYGELQEEALPLKTISIDLPDQEAVILSQQAADLGLSLPELIRRRATEYGVSPIDWSQFDWP